jgi:spermidine synthase
MLVDEQSDFQHIQVISTEFFGKVLLLDGIIQVTELDNAGYHEMITSIPMLACGNPKRVLIVGGGDGGAAQLALRYSTVEQVVVCELDRRVVELSNEHFPCFGNPYADDRVELVIQDAFDYLKQPDNKFDVIISDTTDPIGEAEKLFSIEFYELMVNALTKYGAIATQCEQMYFNGPLIKEMMTIAKTLVKYPAYYHAIIPTYPGGGIGFMYMSNVPWQSGIGRPYPDGMNYFNSDVHKAAFALPEFFKKSIVET